MSIPASGGTITGTRVLGHVNTVRAVLGTHDRARAVMVDEAVAASLRMVSG